MNSQKDKQVIANRRAQPRNGAGAGKDVRVLQSTLNFSDKLSIADDDDRGSDPYNNTGQHCILKSKLIAGE